jgi:transposase
VARRPDLHPLGTSWHLGLFAEPCSGMWDPARNGVSRWHERAGSPEGGRGTPKGGSQAERDDREALSRSRGGYGTKACVIADGLGRAIAFRIAPGQAHELPHAIPLLEQLPGVPKWVVGDRGYTSNGFREHIWSLGAKPAIPPQRHEAPVACPEWIYNNRNAVERL